MREIGAIINQTDAEVVYIECPSCGHNRYNRLRFDHDIIYTGDYFRCVGCKNFIKIALEVHNSEPETGTSLTHLMRTMIEYLRKYCPWVNTKGML